MPSSLASTLPHLSTVILMWFESIFAALLRRTMIASFFAMSFCCSRKETTTQPEVSPQSTSQNLPPFVSITFGSSTTLSFKFRPAESGLIPDTLCHLGFLGPFGFGAGFFLPKPAITMKASLDFTPTPCGARVLSTSLPDILPSTKISKPMAFWAQFTTLSMVGVLISRISASPLAKQRPVGTSSAV